MDHKDVYLGANWERHELKQKIEKYLESKGVHVVDLGVFDIEEKATYAVIADEVVAKVRENPGAKGVLLSHTDDDECMAQNKYEGVNAVCGVGPDLSGVNLICLGGGELDEEAAFKVMDSYFDTNPNT